MRGRVMEAGWLVGSAGEARAIRMREALSRRRLTVGAGKASVPVIALHERGFSVEAAKAIQLPGLVGLFAGRAQMGEGLIVLSAQDGDLVRYEFKRWTDSAEGPARDWAPDE
jgi:hypothetical protein